MMSFHREKISKGKEGFNERMIWSLGWILEF